MAGPWSMAAEMAAKTPAARNRYVDFLRAVSILFVISGHWLIATTFYEDGRVTPGTMLEIAPWTRWLTWLFQVMPVFFIVGGYANAVSLESARRKGTPYARWLAGRLDRLLSPLLVLLLGWTILAVILRAAGVRTEIIRFSSQASLIPIWFLAIYVMIVVLAPATYAFWRRAGVWSFAAFAVLAALTDAAFFGPGWRALGWVNYFWVWLAVHQLGFAWRDDRLGGPVKLLAFAALGLGALVALVFVGPYPLSMVGAPDSDVSNTLPPKITLLALGLGQLGLLLALQGPASRWLARLGPWTATVLINSMIMTIYLWHMTVMTIVVALLYLVDGFGLGIEPGTRAWWLTRPVWLAVLSILLVPVALALAPLERIARAKDAPVPSAARQIAGAVLVCLGLALLARFGVGGGPLPGSDVAALASVFAGALLSGLVGAFRGRPAG